MKFEYDEKETRDPECVALVDIYGTLTIKTDEGCTYLYNDSNTPNNGSIGNWSISMLHSTHKFYPGDKITITF